MDIVLVVNQLISDFFPEAESFTYIPFGFKGKKGAEGYGKIF